MHSFHYRDGRLCCEDVDLPRIAEEFGTPTYVYSAETILDHYHTTRHRARASRSPHLLCGKSELESGYFELARTVRARASTSFRVANCFACSRRVAIRPGAHSQASGNPRDEIEYALEQGVHSFNIESEAELELIQRIARAKKVRAPIALRVNPDVDPHTHQYISTGSQENKFGVALDQASAVYERAAEMSNIEIVGVQMHIGSQITKAKPFASAIEKVAPLVSELKSKYAIKFFSIGGGMGIIYRRALASGSGKWWHDHASEPSAFSMRDYADAVVPPLRGLGFRVLVEPGRFLVGNAGVLLTSVRYIKQTGSKKFAIVDAGMNDLIRPALYQSYHEIVPVKQMKSQRTRKIDIVGPVCESGDFFALDREMPELHEGNLLAIMSAGAYGFVMASNYNSRPLPAEALVDGDKFALIRRRQTWDDLVCGEVDPEW